MPIETPATASEIANRSRTDIAREIDNSNPFLPNSFFGGLSDGLSNRVFDFYFALQDAILEALPDSAVRKIERWAAIWGVKRLAATVATGEINVRGTAGTTIPIGTFWVSSDGERYVGDTGSSGLVASIALAVTSITRTGSTATLTTTGNHRLSGSGAGYNLKVTGAVETEYNLDPLPDLVITGATTLTYTVAGAPSTPATGTPILDLAENAIDYIQLTAVVPGVDGNQVLNTPVTLEQPISGILDKAFVNAGELAGGAAQEENDDLRARYLDRIRNPVAHFNVAEIVATAKLVNGVTRVFVVEATDGGDPGLGELRVYFMRDNDVGTGIPSASEVTDVKTALIGGTVGSVVFPGIKPANTAVADVIVEAPVAVSTAFTFSAIAPDTATMRTAIEANLAQFFAEETEVSVAVPEEAYVAAIQNTVDPANGDKMTSFTLSTPTADIAIATGEIGTLGVITFT